MANHVITAATVVDVDKRRVPSKHYVYVILVTWSNGASTKIYRRYSVFFDLQCKLLDTFPDEAGVYDPSERIIPFLPGKKYLGRSHIRKVALERLQPLNEYCQSIVKLPPEISQCNDVIDFFSVSTVDLNPPTDDTDKKKWKVDKISNPKPFERYVAIAEYRAQKAGEINLEDGMAITEVIEKSESGWWFVSTQDSQGWAPSTYLVKEDGTTDGPVFKATPGSEEKFVVTQNFTGTDEDELTVVMGDTVDVLEKHLQGWWLVRCNKQEGWVPATYLKEEPMPRKPFTSQNVEVVSSLSEISQLFKKESSNNQSKQPPPRTNSLSRGTTPIPSAVSPTYVTIAEFCDKVGDGISFHSGEPVTVLEKTATGWWYVQIAGEEGWAPASYIESQSSGATPNRSPQRDLSSFESDSNDFTSNDSSPQQASDVHHRDEHLSARYSIARPISFDEALATKAKTICEGDAVVERSGLCQVGREARRSSGSVPTTPTDGTSTIPGFPMTPYNKPVVTPKRPTTQEKASLPQKNQMPTPIKGPMTTPVKGPMTTPLKGPMTTPLKGPMTTPLKGPLPTLPNVKQTQGPLGRQSNGYTPHSQDGPVPPKLPSKPSIVNKDFSVIQNSLKNVLNQRNSGEITKPLPVRPSKPVIPRKSSNVTDQSDTFTKERLNPNIQSEQTVKVPPVPPNKPRYAPSGGSTESTNKGPVNEMRKTAWKTDESSDEVEIPKKYSVTDLASALKARLDKNDGASGKQTGPVLMTKPTRKSDFNKDDQQQGGNADNDRNVKKDSSFSDRLNGVNRVKHKARLSGGLRESEGDAVSGCATSVCDVVSNGDEYRVIGDIEGLNDGEISLREGAMVTVQQRDSSGWWFVDDGMTEGWAPMTFLEPASMTADRASQINSGGSGVKPSKPPKPPKK